MSASLAASVGLATGQGVPIGLRQVRPEQVLADALDRAEVEQLVLHDRAAGRPAELLAVEVGERLAVGRVRRQPLEPLEVEQAARGSGWSPTS